MLFDILVAVDVTDPDTGERLGPVEMVKTRVKITQVEDKVSVAATYRTRRVNVGGQMATAVVDRLFQPPKWVTRYETLKLKESFEDVHEDLDEQNSYVLIGDPVVQVLEDELTD